jgi:hypothetical protein
MPLMEGGSLASALRRLSAAARVRAMQDALRGLEALHSCNIFHLNVRARHCVVPKSLFLTVCS